MENNIYNRRHVLKAFEYGSILVLTLFWLSGCRGNMAGQEGGHKQHIIRFGLCADVHKDVIHDADARLKTFIDRMNREKVDFIMQLGDFCRPYDFNQGFLDIWNQFEGPRYHVLGNHDTDGGFTREQTLEFWGTKDKYYSFDLDGYHFVVLDGNDKKEQGAASGYPRYIGEQQAEWLKSDLSRTNSPTLIFSHQSIENSGGVENGQAIRSMLEEANREGDFQKVVACFSGHHHADYYALIEDIYYIQINSMSYEWLGADYKHARFSKAIEEAHPWVSYTAPYKDALYAIVTVRTNGTIEIDGIQSEWIRPSPSELGVPEPKGIDKSTPTISNRILKVR
jgi:predicted phosphodiesterase